MERWEREITGIQKNIFLSLRTVLLINSPHSDLLSQAIRLLGTTYHPIAVTYEQAEEWLREREGLQLLPSILLFDYTDESVKVERFLAQLHTSKSTLVPSPKALAMTFAPSPCIRNHPDIDGVLEKPFKLREIRACLL